MTKSIAIVIDLITGLGLIFIGARFLIAPEIAETGYGIQFDEQGDYSFHYMKGVRDLLLGLLICFFIVNKQTKALAISLLIAPVVPIVDTLIVLDKEYTAFTNTIPHVAAISVCFFLGIVLLKKRGNNREGFTKTVQISQRLQSKTRGIDISSG